MPATRTAAPEATMPNHETPTTGPELVRECLDVARAVDLIGKTDLELLDIVGKSLGAGCDPATWEAYLALRAWVEAKPRRAVGDPTPAPAHHLYRQQIEDALRDQGIGFDSLADTSALHTLLAALGDCAACGVD